MIIKVFLFLILFTLIVPIANSADLYKVSINNNQDAQALSTLGQDVILRLPDGYLILTAPAQARILAESGLACVPIASDIDRLHLALDIRRDSLNINRYDVVYEQGGVRLLRAEPEDLFDAGEIRGLAPLPVPPLKVMHSEPPSLAGDFSTIGIDLDSLVGLVSEDSIRSYVESMEAYYGRTAGTYANDNCRDWLLDRLVEFGYPDAALDPLSLNVYLRGGQEVANVVATKVGTEYPAHQIVIGAHFDAVPDCPGADDNGSGTAGVLEMARVLKDIDTKMTFVFILFNAEEQGLYGASHYATEAAARGDQIVCMLNMDMIGDQRNDTTALVWGAPVYNQLWAQLADSLESIGITALTFPDNRWDDLRFFQNGYDALGVHEFIFSKYYHSHRDSARYMSFDYAARMVMASLATLYTINETYEVQPSLTFSYPDPLPHLLFPDLPDTILLRIEGYAGGTIVPGSGRFQYAVTGGAFQILPLEDLGSSLYRVVLPGLPCFARGSYRFSAMESASGRIYDPPPEASMHEVCVATHVDALLADDFESENGWSVSGDATAGLWERDDPLWYSYTSGAPGWDASGSGKCYATGQPGDYTVDEVNEGTTILTSPPFEITTGLARVSYHRWFYTSINEDIFQVFVSDDDGDTWTLAETVGPDLYTSGGWFKRRIWFEGVADDTAQLRVRFEASDLGIGQHVEAGVDNVIIEQFVCQPYPLISDQILPDWTVGIPYSQQLHSVGGYGAVSWIDKNDDLAGTGLTLSSSGLLSGTPAIIGEISFTAEVTDEMAQTDEHLFEVNVNPTMQISTDSLPPANKGIEYSCQLTSTGGTGARVWRDRDQNLKYSGIFLSPEGLLYGTPLVTGQRTFTAQVTDGLGSIAEQLLTLHIILEFICGDVDYDLADVNISDLTFFVDYMFGGGAEPPLEEAADVDGSGTVDVSDLTYLVDYLFGGGPLPTCQ